jgi:hypothetical protein
MIISEDAREDSFAEARRLRGQNYRKRDFSFVKILAIALLLCILESSGVTLAGMFLRREHEWKSTSTLLRFW